MRIVTRLQAHLAWLERREALLEHLPAERIVSEIALTKQTDDRVRAELLHAVAELNALVRQHNLVVTAPSLHLGTATVEGLLEIARARGASYAARSPRVRSDGGRTGPRRR